MMERYTSTEACSKDTRLPRTPAEVPGVTRSRSRPSQRGQDNRAIGRRASEGHQHHPSTFVAAGQTVLVSLAQWTLLDCSSAQDSIPNMQVPTMYFLCGNIKNRHSKLS